MRGRKFIIGIVLGSMLLGLVASFVVPHQIASGSSAARLELQAALAKAISLAERAASGKATSVRLDTSNPELRWVIGVEAGGKVYEVVVNRPGTEVLAPNEVTAQSPGRPLTTQSSPPTAPAPTDGGKS